MPLAELPLAQGLRLLDELGVQRKGLREEPLQGDAPGLALQLLLDEVEEAVALGHRRVPSKISGVERREVAAAEVPPVRFRFRIRVAGELERGVREDGGGSQGRPGQEGLDLGRRDVGAHHKLEAPVGADRKAYRASASAWVRKPAPAMASSISVWVRELVQYWVNVAVSWESSSVRG